MTRSVTSGDLRDFIEKYVNDYPKTVVCSRKQILKTAIWGWISRLDGGQYFIKGMVSYFPRLLFYRKLHQKVHFPTEQQPQDLVAVALWEHISLFEYFS